VEEVRKLKELPGGDIGISGSVSLVQSLLKHGGIDPPRLQVHPVAFGTAGRKPLFAGLDKTDLRLVGTTVLDSRVDALTTSRAVEMATGDRLRPAFVLYEGFTALDLVGPL